jgi:hypothetical protein
VSPANRVGVFFDPWPPLTNRTLSVERNRLLGGFVVLLAVNLVFGTTFHYRLPWEQWGGTAPLVLVVAKVVYAFTVFHASRVLRQPRWMTVLYVVLAAVSGFELIPLVGLLVGVRVARGSVEEPAG